MHINVLPCKLRLEGHKDNQLMFFICNCAESPEFKRRVTDDECNPCSFRNGANEPEQRTMPEEKTHGRPRIFSDGTIAYPKRGWEPPPCPVGYRRKSEDLKNSDAWTFLPVLPVCSDRHREVEYGRCGAASITYFCTRGPERIRIYDLSTCNKCLGL
jgi:hypothetical protein